MGAVVKWKSGGNGKLVAKLKQMGKAAKKARLTAGFYKDAKYEDGTPVAQVAWRNNFGTVRKDGSEFIPPRPFFNDAINENKDKWAEGLGKKLKTNGFDVENAMNRLGEQMKADIVDSINDWTEPPNAKSTVEEKGRDAPLKDTYHMMRSVGYQYNDESPQYSSGGD